MESNVITEGLETKPAVKLETPQEKAIVKRIAAIKKNGEALQQEIHDVAVACMVHASGESRDARLFKRLFDSLPASIDLPAFRKWFEGYSPIRINADATKVGILKETAKGYVPFDIEAAIATPFWNFKTEKAAPAAMNLEELLKFLANAGNRVERIVGGETKREVGKDVEDNADKLLAVVSDLRKSIQKHGLVIRNDEEPLH